MIKEQEKTTSPIRFILLMVLLLSVAFTWLCVRGSSKIGRLSNLPNYDDVVYFVSAADFLQSVREGGVGGAVDFARRDQLHSPFSTAMAAVAFSIEGLRAAAPYRLNAILIAAYLGGLAYFLRHAERRFLALALVFFLVPPFVTMAVVEFRPDMAWATVVGFLAVFALTRADFFHNRKVAAFYGLCIGLGLLIKPTTFAMTLAVSAMAFGFAWMLEVERADFRSAAGRLFPTLLALALPLVLVAGPYFAIFGESVWRYFIDNSFGVNASVWVCREDRLTQWLYYLDGAGARCNLASQKITILTAWLFFAVRRSWRAPLAVRLQTLFLAMTICIVYVVNAAAPLKSPHLGGAIYGTLFFSLAFFAGEAFASLRSASKEARFNAFSGLVLVTLVALFTYQWPEYSRWPRNAITRSFLTTNRVMERFAREHDTPGQILFTQSGPATMEQVKLLYFRRNQRVVTRSGAFFRTVEEFQSALEHCKVAIVQDAGTPGGTASMPAEPLQDAFVALMYAQSDFSLAQTIPIAAEDGQCRNVYIFERRKAGEDDPAPAVPAKN